MIRALVSTVAAGSSSSRSAGIVAWSGAIVGLGPWLALALDGRHHPDEPLYLYMAAYATVGDILDPELAPAYSFYVSRILHLLLARAIFAVSGPGTAGVQTIAALYAAFVLAAVILGLATVRRLVSWRAEMALAGPALLVSPISLWLVGKTLPESPALLATTLTLYSFVRGLEPGEGRRALPWLVLASAATMAVALTRNVLLLAPLGLGASLLLVSGGVPRGRVLGRGLLVAALGLLPLIGALSWLGIELSAYFWVFGYASAEHSPLVVRLYAGVMAVGPIALVCPWALLHRPRREAWFFLTWFALGTGGPTLCWPTSRHATSSPISCSFSGSPPWRSAFSGIG